MIRQNRVGTRVRPEPSDRARQPDGLMGGPTSKLQTAKLQTAKLQTAKLQTAKLQTAKLQTAKLQTAKLQTAKLQTAKLPRGRDDCRGGRIWV